jgi:SAM-dependent methyltransferase
MSNEPAQTYYAQFAEREWLRLQHLDEATTEFRMTTRMLAQYLPANGRVLDLGGGLGRYTAWLAKQGYRVVLADRTPLLFEQARARLAKAGVTAQVEALVSVERYDLQQWAAEAFDAVLCLGPFHHLLNRAERARVTGEIARVLRPGGVAFVDFLPQYALLQRLLTTLDAADPTNEQSQIDQILDHGVFDGEALNRLARAYGAGTEEITASFAQVGFAMLTLVAGEGSIQEMRSLLAILAKQDQRVLRAVADVIVRMVSDPSMLGAANHLLYIGRKV